MLQNHRLISYISKALPLTNRGLSHYERELWALIHAVHKWITYIFGDQIIIKMDHQSLKYLLEQKVTTMLQQKWLTKLMGFNYTIAYKKGVKNNEVDALSIKGLNDAELATIYIVQSGWLADIRDSWIGDELAQQVMTRFIRQMD